MPAELASPTLAELCEQQNQWHKAASIWAQLLARDPMNENYLARFQAARTKAASGPREESPVVTELKRWQMKLRGRFPVLASRG